MATILCDQSSNCGAMPGGTPNTSAITMTGMGSAKRRQQVNPMAVLEAVDMFMGDGRNARPQPFDPARQKSPVDETSDPGVGGRLELEQRVALEFVEGLEMDGDIGQTALVPAHQVIDLAAEPAVAQDSRYIGVTGQAPVAVLLPSEARALGM
jgi:hypothetical protein